MAEMPKTVDVKVKLKLKLSISDHALRVVKALEANNGVLLPTINQLMAEAWEEGFNYARNDSWTPEANPYNQGASE